MFTHLHLHTESSVADSILKLEEGLEAVEGDGQRAMAITDHGNLGSHFRALVLTRNRAVKPLLGVEAYVDAGLPPHSDGYPRLCHLVLIARNLDGYRNLVRLQRRAWTENLIIGRFPALTLESIEKFHRGLICTTACVGGPVGRAISLGQWDTAENLFMRLNELFGEDFYGEVSAHPLAEQPETNRAISLFAKRAGRRIVQTVDSHYLRATDWITHDCLMKTKEKRRSNYRYAAACFYLAPEWRVRSYGLPSEWIDETNRVAEKCTAAEELTQTLSGIPAGPKSPAFEELFLSASVPVTPYDALRSASSWAGLPEEIWRKQVKGATFLRAFAKKYPTVCAIASGLESLPRAVAPDFRYKIAVSESLKDLVPVRVIDGLQVAEIDHVTAAQLRLPVRKTTETERRSHQPISDFYTGLAHWWNDRHGQAITAFRASIAKSGPIQAKIRLAQALREIGKSDESDKWLSELRQDPLIESLHLKKSVTAIGRVHAAAGDSDGLNLQLYPESARLTIGSSFNGDFHAIQKTCDPVFSNGIQNLIVSAGRQRSRLKSPLTRLEKFLNGRGVKLHVNLDLSQIPTRIDRPISKPKPTRMKRRRLGSGVN